MKFKNSLNIVTFAAVCLLVSVIFAIITAFENINLAIIEVAFILTAAVLGIGFYFVNSYKNKKSSDLFGKRIAVKSDALNSFPLPVMVANKNDRITWKNDIFLTDVSVNGTIINNDASEYLNGVSVMKAIKKGSFTVEINNKFYVVFADNRLEEGLTAFYYFDVTDYHNTAQEYKLSRPVIMYISLDNFYETFIESGNSESGIIQNEIEKIIRDWLFPYNIVMRRLNSDRIMVVCESRDLEKMKERKFGMLDKVRSFTYAKRPAGITLSVGVGTGENFAESSETARQALEMAIGRGGDQAALKYKDSYEFYGGATKGVEKRGKSKSRIAAGAISELINSSDNVLVMGHRFSDLDCIGSAMGIVSCANAVNIKVNILVNKETSLAKNLIERIEKEYKNGLFIEPDKAVITKKTLLILVDTHRKSFSEYPEIVDRVQKVIIIDHHRKAVDYLSEALMFYHDPGASSSCELVTELIQYMPVKTEPSVQEAEALLAGIMLDTKNFVLNAGVRTFEAAAFLKGTGADTVNVRKLFSNTLEINKIRNEIVSNSSVYLGTAISVVNSEYENIRMICSQAADEMLNISGVSASFVIYKTGNTVNVSARSLGERNVQLIMEELGGGGHFTMAAAQLENSDTNDVYIQLKSIIEKREEQ